MLHELSTLNRESARFQLIRCVALFCRVLQAIAERIAVEARAQVSLFHFCTLVRLVTQAAPHQPEGLRDMTNSFAPL